MNSMGPTILSPTLILHHYSPTDSNGITRDFPQCTEIEIHTPILETYLENNNGCEIIHLDTMQQKENHKCLSVKILLLFKPIVEADSSLTGAAEGLVQQAILGFLNSSLPWGSNLFKVLGER